MKSLKENKIEIILFVVVFLLFVLFTYINNNTFLILLKYLFDPSYEEFLINDMQINNFSSPILFILLKPFIYNSFDIVIIWSSTFFQLIITFISSLACYTFGKRHFSINQMIYYKKGNFINAIIKQILNYSIKIAFSIFIGYICFYLICITLGKAPQADYYDGVLPRTLFLDLFGNDFYFEKANIYWLLEGFIRFFLVPLQYAIISCLLCINFKSIKDSYIVCNLIYVLSSAVLGALSYIPFFGKIVIYMNPSVIMASGTYDLETIPLLFFSFAPIIIIVIIQLFNKDQIYE